MSGLKMEGAPGWLRALRDKNVADEVLAAQLTTWLSEGSVLQNHTENELDPPIEPSTSRWTAEHFRLQVDAAKRNFSHERARHLLDVRKRLRQLGEDGFITMPSLRESRANAVVARVAETFEPTPSLAKAIASEDIGLIRAALRLEIADMRLPGSYLQGAMGWSATQYEGIFVPYEEGRFKGAMDSSKEAWTAEYHSIQIVFLKANFSIKRFLHVIEVREHLRTTGAAGFTPPVQTPATGQRTGSAAVSPGSASSQHGRRPQQQPEQQPEPPSDSWPTRIAIMLAAGLAALAAYFLGGRR